MSKENVGGLLEMLANWDTQKPFYIVGQRPLDYEYGNKKHNTSESIGHEHFIRNDGVNFGFAGNGEFVEPSSMLDIYELTPKYGLKMYDADLLEKARQNWNNRNDEMSRVIEELDLQEYDPNRLYNEYALDLNNCKGYVKWLDGEYDRLKNGIDVGR
jgi:hypothetical protein